MGGIAIFPFVVGGAILGVVQWGLMGIILGYLLGAGSFLLLCRIGSLLMKRS